VTIEIEELNFQAILGILDFERVTPQDITLNVLIEYNYSDEFINYADVVNLIKSHMKNEKFLLIEDALVSLSLKLKEKFSLINNLHLKITKPSILPDAKVSVSNTYIF
jgi:dihydroneopterin aldolase